MLPIGYMYTPYSVLAELTADSVKTCTTWRSLKFMAVADHLTNHVVFLIARVSDIDRRQLPDDRWGYCSQSLTGFALNFLYTQTPRPDLFMGKGSQKLNFNCQAR